MCTRSLVASLTVIIAIAVIVQGSVLPTRPPGGFASANELRSYLVQLNKYYAAVGQPRFGKRTSVFNKESNSLPLNMYISQAADIQPSSFWNLLTKLDSYYNNDQIPKQEEVRY